VSLYIFTVIYLFIALRMSNLYYTNFSITKGYGRLGCLYFLSSLCLGYYLERLRHATHIFTIILNADELDLNGATRERDCVVYSQESRHQSHYNWKRCVAAAKTISLTRKTVNLLRHRDAHDVPPLFPAFSVVCMYVGRNVTARGRCTRAPQCLALPLVHGPIPCINKYRIIISY